MQEIPSCPLFYAQAIPKTPNVLNWAAEAGQNNAKEIPLK
jgi:hypothetical protein